MIYCFTKTEGELVFYYFKDTNPIYYRRRGGLSIKKGIIRKRLTIKVLEKIYNGYSQDFLLRFKMNKLELSNSYLAFLESMLFGNTKFRLLYKI